MIGTFYVALNSLELMVHLPQPSKHFLNTSKQSGISLYGVLSLEGKHYALVFRLKQDKSDAY